MGTKREDGTFDDVCLQKAEPGEPIFVLRAQDLFADGLIERWADMLESIKGEPGLTESRQLKIDEARACASKMRAWRSFHQRGKFPD